MRGFPFLILGACGTAKAQAPEFGQPYQLPAGYEGYGAGTVVAYGGYNYVIRADRTMQLSSPSLSRIQTATCFRQPVALSSYSTQLMTSYFYRPGCYRHYYRFPTRCVSWYGGYALHRHCHYR